MGPASRQDPNLVDFEVRALPDSRVEQTTVDFLSQQFANIRSNLSLKNVSQASPDDSNVGHRAVIAAVNSFNGQIQSTRNTY